MAVKLGQSFFSVGNNLVIVGFSFWGEWNQKGVRESNAYIRCNFIMKSVVICLYKWVCGENIRFHT